MRDFKGEIMFAAVPLILSLALSSTIGLGPVPTAEQAPSSSISSVDSAAKWIPATYPQARLDTLIAKASHYESLVRDGVVSTARPTVLMSKNKSAAVVWNIVSSTLDPSSTFVVVLNYQNLIMSTEQEDLSGDPATGYTVRTLFNGKVVSTSVLHPALGSAARGSTSHGSLSGAAHTPAYVDPEDCAIASATLATITSISWSCAIIGGPEFCIVIGILLFVLGVRAVTACR